MFADAAFLRANHSHLPAMEDMSLQLQHRWTTAEKRKITADYDAEYTAL